MNKSKFYRYVLFVSTTLALLSIYYIDTCTTVMCVVICNIVYLQGFACVVCLFINIIISKDIWIELKDGQAHVILAIAILDFIGVVLTAAVAIILTTMYSNNWCSFIYSVVVGSVYFILFPTVLEYIARKLVSSDKNMH